MRHAALHVCRPLHLVAHLQDVQTSGGSARRSDGVHRRGDRQLKGRQGVHARGGERGRVPREERGIQKVRPARRVLCLHAQPRHPLHQLPRLRGRRPDGRDHLHLHGGGGAALYRRELVELSLLHQPVHQALQRDHGSARRVPELPRLRGAHLRARRRGGTALGRSLRRSGQGEGGRLAYGRQLFLPSRAGTHPRSQRLRHGGTPRRHRRAHRLRQDDGHQPSDALLRRERRQRQRGRQGRARSDARVASEKLRHGAAGDVAQTRDRPRKSVHGQTGLPGRGDDRRL